jgi:hypothetical protein
MILRRERAVGSADHFVRRIPRHTEHVIMVLPAASHDLPILSALQHYPCSPRSIFPVVASLSAFVLEGGTTGVGTNVP